MKTMHIKRKNDINEVKFIPWTTYLKETLDNNSSIINKFKNQTEHLCLVASLIYTK